MKNEKLLVAVLTYNNGADLKNLIERIPHYYPYDIIIHVDGSNDGSEEILKEFNFKVINKSKNSGIGRSMRNVIEYAKENNYEAVAFIPGNNKNDLAEVYRLFNPIINNKADYVQGSRFLKGGKIVNTDVII